MDLPTLSEQERRWYWELFRLLDDGSEQLPGAKVFDMFLTSGLQPELVRQIVELCGAKRLGHFGRNEFYIALKLISAAQNGFVPVLDICSSGLELPVPRLVINPEQWRSQAILHQSVNQPISKEQHFIYYDRGGVPVLPATVPQHQPGAPVRMYQAPRSMSLVVSSDAQPVLIQDQRGSPPLPTADRLDKRRVPAAVHHAQPVTSNNAAVAAQAPHNANIPGTHNPTVHGHGDEHKRDKGWAMFEDDCQGLINPDCKDWTQFAAEGGKAADTSSMSSESMDDVWSITDEQREYYVRQFQLMQEDLTGVISGAVAKEFFEKSKLPIQELSKIWQLSDVNRDGALSLDEFCTAMHLVVLRRNDIELPDTLPPVLQPYTPLIKSDEPFSADLQPDSSLKKLSPTPSTSSQPWTTAFQLPESPTSSSVSSPGNKPTPVNFEVRPITADSDSKIVHPVAMRLSPDSQPFTTDVMTSSTYSDGPKFNGLRDQPLQTSTTAADNNEMLVSPGPTQTELLIDFGPIESAQAGTQYHGAQITAGPLHGRPRPTPKKAQSLPGPSQEMLSLGILPPPPNQESFSAGDRSLPGADNIPLPPPRASLSSHSRSSSLDNQLIDFSEAAGGSKKVKLPPVVPPRSSPKELVSSPGSSGADRPGSRDEVDPSYRTTRPNVSKLGSLERRDLQASIRNQKERNMVLSRLNSELNQELQEVMEQRIALEIQMEHLRPFHS